MLWSHLSNFHCLLDSATYNLVLQGSIYCSYRLDACLLFFGSRGFAGMLPIHAAALNGYVDCVRKLRAAMPAIDINIPDDFGRTCLHGAACSGWVFPSCLELWQRLQRAYGWVLLFFIFLLQVYCNHARLTSNFKERLPLCIWPCAVMQNVSTILYTISAL